MNCKRCKWRQVEGKLSNHRRRQSESRKNCCGRLSSGTKSVLRLSGRLKLRAGSASSREVPSVQRRIDSSGCSGLTHRERRIAEFYFASRHAELRREARWEWKRDGAAVGTLARGFGWTGVETRGNARYRPPRGSWSTVGSLVSRCIDVN